MTTEGDEEQLAINVIAKLNDLEKQMAKASGITAKAFREMTLTTRKATRQMEQDAARSGERIHSAMATVGTRIGAVGRTFAVAAAAAFSTDKLIAASQSYVRASNSLKVAGLSGNSLADTFDRLYRIAQENGAPIETLVGLYSKAAQVQTALGASSNQLIQFTTAVAQALRVSGTSAEEAQGALLQMGQALGAGTVHAEEYNSMLEGAYPILQAAAAGIKEAGGEVGKLTTLVKDGQVSSKAFFYGVLAGSPTLTDKLAGSTETLSQAWTKFENALAKAVGEIDAATGATGNLANGLESLIPWIEKMPSAIDWASEKWAKFKAAVNDAAGALNHLMGIDTDEAARAAGLVPIEEARAEAAREKLAKKNTNVTGGGFGGDDTGAAKRIGDAFSLFDGPKAAVQPVSLKDYPAEGKKKKGDGGGSANEYEREVAAVQKKIEALRVEAEMVGKTAYEQDKAKEVQRLLSAAKEAEIPITDELKQKINDLAGSYAAVADQVRNAKAEHDRLIDSADQMRDAFKDVTKGFVSDLMHGKSAAEALSNALMRMADRLLDRAMDVLTQGLLGKFGTGGGGIFGSLFGGLFAGLFGGAAAPATATPTMGGLYDVGGYTGPGHRLEPAGVVHRGEYVFDADTTRAIGVGNLEAMRRASRRGYASGGWVGASPSVAASAPTAVIQQTFINNSSASVSTREEPDGRGGRRQVVVIEDAVGRAVSRPGSSAHAAVGRAFGMKGGVTRR